MIEHRRASEILSAFSDKASLIESIAMGLPRRTFLKRAIREIPTKTEGVYIIWRNGSGSRHVGLSRDIRNRLFQHRSLHWMVNGELSLSSSTFQARAFEEFGLFDVAKSNGNSEKALKAAWASVIAKHKFSVLPCEYRDAWIIEKVVGWVVNAELSPHSH